CHTARLPDCQTARLPDCQTANFPDDSGELASQTVLSIKEVLQRWVWGISEPGVGCLDQDDSFGGIMLRPAGQQAKWRNPGREEERRMAKSGKLSGSRNKASLRRPPSRTPARPAARGDRRMGGAGGRADLQADAGHHGKQ